MINLDEYEMKTEHLLPEQSAAVRDAVFRPRPADTHKGDYGRVLIVAGSRGMTGAALLCAESALRSGAGLVYLAAPRGLMPVYEISLREVIKIGMGTETDTYFTAAHLAAAEDAAAQADCVILGPGLGRHPETQAFIKSFVKWFFRKSHGLLVLDADGINAYAGEASVLSALSCGDGACRLILTPHEMEMARLMACPLEAVRTERIRTAAKAAVRFGAISVLKGSGTVTAMPASENFGKLRTRPVVYCTVNHTGNPGMATAGSGDVLAGMIGAYIASRNGMTLYDAVRSGVFMHGLCGDIAKERYGERAMIAGDLIQMLGALHTYDKI